MRINVPYQKIEGKPVAVDLVAHKVLDDGAAGVGAAREGRVVVLLELVPEARQVHAAVHADLGRVARPEGDFQILGHAPTHITSRI